MDEVYTGQNASKKYYDQGRGAVWIVPDESLGPFYEYFSNR